jgi:hypothetical protein
VIASCFRFSLAPLPLQESALFRQAVADCK